MICHTISAQVGAIEQVIQAVKAGELLQKDIAASVDRVRNLKDRYLFSNSPIPTSTLATSEARNTKQSSLASEIYAKSTTVVRSVPRSFPLSSYPKKKIVFVSPGKAPVGGGAVESGEEKTREYYTPASYIDLLRAQDPNVLDVRFHGGTAISADGENQIAEADAVIFATRNASLSSYQKEYGLALGKKLGEKLIVVATCDPYDFLEEKDEIKNYITIYEPTIPAFKSAVDIIFGVTKPLGTLPVGIPLTQHEIRPFTNSEADIDKLWSLWHVVFPKWPIERPRLSKLLGAKNGLHYFHDKGFCISYLMDGPQAKIAAVGKVKKFRSCPDIPQEQNDGSYFVLPDQCLDIFTRCVSMKADDKELRGISKKATGFGFDLAGMNLIGFSLCFLISWLDEWESWHSTRVVKSTKECKEGKARIEITL